MTPAEGKILGAALRFVGGFVGGLVEGKEPGPAFAEAVLPLLPRQQLPPPSPPFDFFAAAKAPPPAPVDEATAAVQKKIDALEDRAAHPNTPEEEARTAAVAAVRLRRKISGKGSVPGPSSAPSAPPPAPANTGRTETTRTEPDRRPTPEADSTSVPKTREAVSLLVAAKPTCPKCNRPIHRGGVMRDQGDGRSAARYHAKCAPRPSNHPPRGALT